jgi:hypothetical protein
MSEQKSYKYLTDKISLWLDTRDKRFIFLWMIFPGAASRINLEGSAQDAAYEMSKLPPPNQRFGSGFSPVITQRS